ENSLSLPALLEASTTSVIFLSFCGVLDQQGNKFLGKHRQFIELPHANVQSPKCPCIVQGNNLQRHLFYIAARGGLGYDPYADMSGNHAARRLEVADRDAKAKYPAQIVGGLQ